MRARPTLALALTLAALASPGAARNPPPEESGPAYAKIEGGRVPGADPDAYPLRIVAVDGRQYMGMPTSVRLKPGPHWLQVASGKVFRGSVTHQPMPVKVLPCTTYYVYARHVAKKLSNAEWEIVYDGKHVRQDCDPVAAGYPPLPPEAPAAGDAAPMLESLPDAAPTPPESMPAPPPSATGATRGGAS